MVFKNLIQHTLEFLQLNDFDLILETILVETRKFLNADAGTIYFKEGDNLVFKYTQNDSIQSTKSEILRLKYAYKTIPINENSIAGFVAKNKIILNIEDAYNLPANIPFTFNKSFDKSSGYRTKSILAAPITDSEDNLLGVIQIINKKVDNNVVIFNKDDELIVKYFAKHAAIAIERSLLNKEIILRMVKMAQMRDPKETGAHVKRVSEISAVIYNNYAEQKGIDEVEILRKTDILKPAATLHDVGKVAISDYVLKKPGKLTEEEYQYMKMHTVFGARLFEGSSQPLDKACQEVALNHHERWDGKGYPGKILNLNTFTVYDLCKEPKKEDEIPLFGRIVAVADVFDALISKRSYKESWTFDDAIEEIEKKSGSQFDPFVVAAFIKGIEEIEAIVKFYQD